MTNPTITEGQRMISFHNKDSVQPNDTVEIRYTNNNEFYRDLATVVRVNPRSIRVRRKDSEGTWYFKQNTVNNCVMKVDQSRLEEITKEIQDFNQLRKKRREAIDRALSKVEWSVPQPVIDVEGENGERQHSINIMELVHPTTAQSVKAVAQLEAASERREMQYLALQKMISDELEKEGITQ